MDHTHDRTYILTLSCPDIHGIVHAVATFIKAQGCFILESTQYGDPTTEHFFMRMHFKSGENTPDHDGLKAIFAAEIGTPFHMRWTLSSCHHTPRVLIMVSKFGHCLNDLLHRHKIGALPIAIPAVVSNHEDMRDFVEWHGIPYYHMPITPDTKTMQEDALLDLIETEAIDLTVLARYMQILSPRLCAILSGKAINIHHSFLPSFKGARPYHQAHQRGVKLIGATAHYVTSDLDEGPIIEQEVARVNHTHTIDDLCGIGRDIESRVLARAVKMHVEHRVLRNGDKTVVFG